MIVPGRILIIDDAPTEKERQKIQRLIDSLSNNGESVLFSASTPNNEECYENVRLLIVDLLINPAGKDESLETLATIIDKLSRKTPYFVIAIWTKATGKTRRNAVEDVKNAFQARTEKELKAVMLEPFAKNISPTELVKQIKRSMRAVPECALLFELEKITESARDKTISEIISASEISTFIQALKEEIGETSLNREVINVFLKLLSRNSQSTRSLQACLEALIKKKNIENGKYGNIHSLISYFMVDRGAIVWTGDVLYKIRKKTYMVVTLPACDFAQRKTRRIDFIKVLPAIRIDHDALSNPDQLELIKKQFNLKKEINEIPGCILSRNLPERYYSLVFLKDTNTGKLFHLILDFQGVSNIDFIEKGSLLGRYGFARVCRIDNPLVNDLIQAYSTYSSRVGVPSVPIQVVKNAKPKPHHK
jgi:hypothetical protein